MKIAGAGLIYRSLRKKSKPNIYSCLRDSIIRLINIYARSSKRKHVAQNRDSQHPQPQRRPTANRNSWHAPRNGATDRFQARLAEQRKAARIRQIIGTLIFVIGGLGLIYWMVGPLVQEALRSPAEWITTAVGYFLFVLTSIQTLSEVSLILMRVIPTFISPLGWLVLISIFGGLGLIWAVAITRFARLPQGV